MKSVLLCIYLLVFMFWHWLVSESWHQDLLGWLGPDKIWPGLTGNLIRISVRVFITQISDHAHPAIINQLTPLHRLDWRSETYFYDLKAVCPWTLLWSVGDIHPSVSSVNTSPACDSEVLQVIHISHQESSQSTTLQHTFIKIKHLHIIQVPIMGQVWRHGAYCSISHFATKIVFFAL